MDAIVFSLPTADRVDVGDADRVPVPAGLNPRSLEQLQSLDPTGKAGVVARILGAYEASLERTIQTLLSAPDGLSAAVLRDLAHPLKSSSASVGATHLAEVSDQVERDCRNAMRGDAAATATAAQVHLLMASCASTLGVVRRQLGS